MSPQESHHISWEGAWRDPWGEGTGLLGPPEAQALHCFLCSSGDVKQEGMGAFREGPPYQRRGALQLWQFLVALLDDPTNAHFIAWTGRGMEFKLIEPEEVGLSDVSAPPPNSVGGWR